MMAPESTNPIRTILKGDARVASSVRRDLESFIVVSKRVGFDEHALRS